MNPWIAKALVLTGSVVMIAIRAPHRHRSRIERMMVEEFGDEYAEYSARTKRLIPRVW
jgi:protein-S-isoprenylcysteine O-methyltransferase Ste14